MVMMDTKLTSIHFNWKVPNKLLDMDPFCSSSFSDTTTFHATHWDTKVMCHNNFFHICVNDLGFTLMSQLQCLKMSHDNYCLCVYLSPNWILYLIVNSCGVSYVNSDSHQMCNIFLKYYSTVIATLFFESAFVIFYDILTLPGVFNTEKLYSPIFKIRKTVIWNV